MAKALNTHQQAVLAELRRLILPPEHVALQGGEQTAAGDYPAAAAIDLDAHLEGTRTFAVRLAWDSDAGPVARAGCIDVDEGEGSVALVRKLADTAAAHGLAVLAEHSGRKGGHLWVLTEPVPVDTLQRALERLHKLVPCKGELIPTSGSPQVKLPPAWHQAASMWAFFYPPAEVPHPISQQPSGFWPHQLALLRAVQPTPRAVLAAFAADAPAAGAGAADAEDLVPHLDKLDGKLPPCLRAVLEHGGHHELGTWNQNALGVARYAVSVGLSQEQADALALPLVERPAVETSKDEHARKRNWASAYGTARQGNYRFSCQNVLKARPALRFDCGACAARPAGVHPGGHQVGGSGPFQLEPELALQLVGVALHRRRELLGVTSSVLPTTKLQLAGESVQVPVHHLVLQAAAAGVGSVVEVAGWFDACPLDALVGRWRAEQAERKGVAAALRTVARGAAVALAGQALAAAGLTDVEEHQLLARAVALSRQAQLDEALHRVHAGLRNGTAAEEVAAQLQDAARPLQVAAQDFGRPLADFSTELLEGMQQVERPVVPSGLERLDFLLGGGFMGGKLYVLAAPPGAGKTTLAAQVADEAASRGVPVLFVALEMSRGELFDRAISRAAGVDSSLLESRRLAAYPELEERVADALDRYMGETAQHLAVEEGDYSTTPDRMAAWVRQARARYGLTEEQPVLVVVDYLQLLYTGKPEVDTQPGEVARVSEVAVLLKRLARNTNAAVLALSDVNREEQRTATKLQEITLSALRGSNRIGHAADTVLALYSEQGQDTGGKARNDPWDALAARLKDNPRATTFLRELDTAKANVLPGGGRGAQVFAVLELLKNRGGRGKGSLPLFYQRAFHRLLAGPTAGLDEIEGRGGGRS